MDGVPWSFVYECRESSLPQEALDATFLFSPHSMMNMRGAVVPTKHLVPRIESMDQRKWKVVGIWKKRSTSSVANASSSSSSSSDEDDDEDDDDDVGAQGGVSSSRRHISRLRRRQSHHNNNPASGRGGIHDMDLDEGMPPLGGNSEGNDLENIAPVRIEAWMVKVFHYGADANVTMDKTVMSKMFCILTVTPARNFNLAEYLRHSIVENTQGTLFPGMSQQASEIMRKDKKVLLVAQLSVCAFCAKH